MKLAPDPLVVRLSLSGNPPTQALVINNRLLEHVKYRDAHQPCPFDGDGKATPSPELLAGRPMRRHNVRAASPHKPGWAFEPMVVRKAMISFVSADGQSCCHSNFEEEFRTRNTATGLRRRAKRCFQRLVRGIRFRLPPEAQLIRSKGSLV